MEHNVPLLRKTMEYIEENPDRWDQDNWFRVKSAIGIIYEHEPVVPATTEYYRALNEHGCGTTMCFAGTACWLSGDTVVGLESVMTPEGQVVDVEERAAELLGLSFAEAFLIFSYGTSFTGLLRRKVEQVTGEVL